MASGKQQFNVNLAPDLITRVKHRAVDAQMSLSDLISAVLEAHLSKENAVSQQPTGLALQPMVHVENMEAAVSFYEALGASIAHGSRDGDFVLLNIGTGQMSLLAHPPNPEQNEAAVELNFETSEDLHAVEARLLRAGVHVVQPTSDEAFGRQLQIATPDGLLVKINELEPDLYT